MSFNAIHTRGLAAPTRQLALPANVESDCGRTRGGVGLYVWGGSAPRAPASLAPPQEEREYALPAGGRRH
jgi:hypothetical protein